MNSLPRPGPLLDAKTRPLAFPPIAGPAWRQGVKNDADLKRWEHLTLDYLHDVPLDASTLAQRGECAFAALWTLAEYPPLIASRKPPRVFVRFTINRANIQHGGKISLPEIVRLDEY